MLSVSRVPVPDEASTKLQEVLETMMASSTSAEIRRKANQWLTEFQKAQDTHTLVLTLLNAAYSRENTTLGLPLVPSPATVTVMGAVSAASRSRLLFFLAQTLNAKLRRAVQSDLKAGPSQLLHDCSPTALLSMARRAAEQDSPAVARALALAVGQICTLEIEHSPGDARQEVTEVLASCFEALRDDATKWHEALAALEGGAAMEAGLKRAVELVERNSIAKRFAVEIFSAVASSGRAVLKNRGLDPKVKTTLQTFLTQSLEAVGFLTRQGQIHFFRLGLIPAFNRRCGPTHSTQLSHVSACELVRLVCVELTELSQLSTTLSETLLQVSSSHTDSDTQRQSTETVTRISQPLTLKSLEIFSLLAELLVESKLPSILSQLKQPDYQVDVSDAFRQTLVAAAEEIETLAEFVRAPPAVRQRRRASLPAVSTTVSEETARDATAVAERQLLLGYVFHHAWDVCQLSSLRQEALRRLQTARSYAALAAHAGANVSSNAAHPLFLAALDQEFNARQQEASATAVNFWERDGGWHGLGRAQGDTPNELLPNPPVRDEHSDDEDLVQDDDEQPSGFSSLLALEEAFTGALLAQLSMTLGLMAHNLAPAYAAGLLAPCTGAVSAASWLATLIAGGPVSSGPMSERVTPPSLGPIEEVPILGGQSCQRLHPH